MPLPPLLHRLAANCANLGLARVRLASPFTTHPFTFLVQNSRIIDGSKYYGERLPPIFRGFSLLTKVSNPMHNSALSERHRVRIRFQSWQRTESNILIYQKRWTSSIADLASPLRICGQCDPSLEYLSGSRRTPVSLQTNVGRRVCEIHLSYTLPRPLDISAGYFGHVICFLLPRTRRKLCPPTILRGEPGTGLNSTAICHCSAVTSLAID